MPPLRIGPDKTLDRSCCVIDSLGWYPVTVCFSGQQLEQVGDDQPWWLEGHPDAPDNLLVINTLVTPVRGPEMFEMDVLISAAPGTEVPIRADTSICTLRIAEKECHDAVESFRIARATRVTEEPLLAAAKTTKVTPVLPKPALPR